MTDSFLRDYQLDAIKRMRNGCILNGGVGSGKSRTSLYYYYIQYGGKHDPAIFPMTDPPDLYIITTAKKRDDKEWDEELKPFRMDKYKNQIVIDSWNNIKKYVDVKNAFFIFDEDRVTGAGVWAKSFLKIVKNNKWIILSATPGDKPDDYIPVFIANGFYRNRTEFYTRHAVWVKHGTFWTVDRWLELDRIYQLRDSLLVDMDFERETIAHHEIKQVNYDIEKYNYVCRNRWNPYTNEPIENAPQFCYVLRKVVNSDESRIVTVFGIMKEHPKVIIFYSFDYELELLKGLAEKFKIPYSEWNGHKHEAIPETDKWMYLVNYSAGAEGWSCIKTDTIIFYSQNYSYKTMVQASGRIDRLNTPFKDLYYYHLKSKSKIDYAISLALNTKKKFNEKTFYDSNFG